MNVYRTPDEQFRGLPGYAFAPHYVDQDGLRMHYVDEGRGDPVLLLHGEPTWSFLYRKMIPAIARVARAVAPDYFGFGRSDKPTDRRWYSYDRHVEYTSSLLGGQSKRIEYPADGFDSWVTRRVYKGDELIHDDTFHSHYSRVDGVTLIGR